MAPARRAAAARVVRSAARAAAPARAAAAVARAHVEARRGAFLEACFGSVAQACAALPISPGELGVALGEPEVGPREGGGQAGVQPRDLDGIVRHRGPRASRVARGVELPEDRQQHVEIEDGRVVDRHATADARVGEDSGDVGLRSCDRCLRRRHREIGRVGVGAGERVGDGDRRRLVLCGAERRCEPEQDDGHRGGTVPVHGPYRSEDAPRKWP